jgi:hypothetical protein
MVSVQVVSALDELDRHAAIVEKEFSESVAFFGEDPAKCSPEEFFSLFLAFGGEFARVSFGMAWHSCSACWYA